MEDKYSKYPKSIDSVAENAYSITPDDGNDLPNVTRSIYVGAAGDLEVIMIGDTSPVTFANVQAGSVLPFRIKRVLAGNTSADDLVALL